VTELKTLKEIEKDLAKDYTDMTDLPSYKWGYRILRAEAVEHLRYLEKNYLHRFSTEEVKDYIAWFFGLEGNDEDLKLGEGGMKKEEKRGGASPEKTENKRRKNKENGKRNRTERVV